MKQQPMNKQVKIINETTFTLKVSTVEKDAFFAAAKAEGISTSAWARENLRKAAKLTEKQLIDKLNS